MNYDARLKDPLVEHFRIAFDSVRETLGKEVRYQAVYADDRNFSSQVSDASFGRKYYVVDLIMVHVLSEICLSPSNGQDLTQLPVRIELKRIPQSAMLALNPEINTFKG